jgi:hypothetical protein
MRKYYIVIFLMLAYLGGLVIFGSSILADNVVSKELTISQIKITGDEFVVLHNNTNTNLQLGNFWLQYYNDFNILNAGISNSSMQLPAVTLLPGQEILLSVGAAANCGQVWVSKLSFSLKDSAGLLQVVGISQAGGLVGYKSEDQVSWSSKTTDPVDIKGVSSSAVAQIWNKPAGFWVASASPPGCTAIGTTSSSSTNTPSTLTRASDSPPSIVLGASTDTNTGFSSANAGLAAPQISELLPNPAPPGADATDEFIELYNPNSLPFDLSGFALRTGTTTFHNYIFPSGQFILQPHEFRAFYAPQTGISLSNGASQAALLDPSGNMLLQTDAYDNAKDGYAWVYAEGLWQWTTTTTPNSTNIITTPAPSKTTASKARSAAIVAAAKTSKSSSSKKPTGTASSGNFVVTEPAHSNLHPLILAGVGGLAVLYALYEYRNDLANQLYRFRRYRAARREFRQIA